MILDVLIHQLERIRKDFGGDIEVRIAPTDGKSYPQDNYMLRQAYLTAGRDWEKEYVCLDIDPTSNPVGISNEERFRDLMADMG